MNLYIYKVLYLFVGVIKGRWASPVSGKEIWDFFRMTMIDILLKSDMSLGTTTNNVPTLSLNYVLFGANEDGYGFCEHMPL